jgi:hypothetical protein
MISQISFNSIELRDNSEECHLHCCCSAFVTTATAANESLLDCRLGTYVPLVDNIAVDAGFLAITFEYVRCEDFRLASLDSS